MNIKNNEYAQLLPVAKEVRKALKPYVSHYIRVFTEPRVNGLRSKFWAGKLKQNQLDKVDAVIDALNAKYTSLNITVKQVKNIPYNSISTSIYVKYK